MQLNAGDEVCRAKYRLIRLLGTGGFASVYEAENLATKRRVALKAVHGESAGPEVVERLRREAVVSSRVRHPNVVDVYDLEEENGIWFLVMEYVHGETLRQALDRTRPPPSVSASLLISVMRGLSLMHRHGVVHRDIKPENIYLARQSESTHINPKLLDFGICKVAQPDAELPPLTRAGTQGMGTALYMSPEQYADSAGVDARADIYAMGVVLYECFTGCTPYSGASQRELLLKMLTTNAPSVNELRPELPAELGPIVAKALSKDAAERYQSIDELADALVPFAAATLPEADAVLAARSSQLPALAPLKKKRGSAWLIALSALIVAQICGLYWAANARHGEQPSAALFAPRGVLAGFFLPRSVPKAQEAAVQQALGGDAAVEVICDLPGAELYINGERVGFIVSGAPMQLSLPPGLYRFEAMRNGELLASDMALVQPGGTFELQLRAPTIPAAALQAKGLAPRNAAALVSTARRSAADSELIEGLAAELSQEQLSDVIKSHLDVLQRCYESALVTQGKELSSEPASLELELSIAAAGNVTFVRTQGQASAKLPGIDACFERNVRSWLFPQARQATQLRFPLVFRRVGSTQLSTAQLTAVFARSKSMLQRCARGSGVRRLDVNMEVLPSGTVSSVKIDGDTPDVGDCIARTVRMWQFPSAVEATRTRFPVLLMPGA